MVRTLHGRFVTLAPLGHEHVDGLARIAAGDRASFRYTFVPETREQVVDYVERVLREQEAGTAVPYAILQGGEVVGTTRFGYLERWIWFDRPPSAHPDAAEIGWTWLDPAAQGTAVNPESKRLMLAEAFDGWGMQRIRLITDVRNERSRRAIAGIGARFEGVWRGHFPAADGSIRDSASFSILRSEWPDVRERLDARLALSGAGPADPAPPAGT